MRSTVREISHPPTSDLRQLPVGAIFGNREYETNLSHSCHWNIEYETNRPMDSAQPARGHPNRPFLENPAPRTVFIQAGPPTPYKQVYLSMLSLEHVKYFALLHFSFSIFCFCYFLFRLHTRKKSLLSNPNSVKVNRATS